MSGINRRIQNAGMQKAYRLRGGGGGVGWLGYDGSNDGAYVDITTSDVSVTNAPGPQVLRLSDTLQVTIYVTSDYDIYAVSQTISSGKTTSSPGTLLKIKDNAAPPSAYNQIQAVRLTDTKFLVAYQIFDGVSTYTLYSRTYNVTHPTIAADAAELNVSNVSSGSFSLIGSSSTRALLAYANTSGKITVIGLQIGSGTLTKDSSATSDTSTSMAPAGRVGVKEDSATIGFVSTNGKYKRFDFDGTTTTDIAGSTDFSVYKFNNSSTLDISGCSLYQHPSADNRIVLLVHTNSNGATGRCSPQTFLFRLNTASGASLDIATPVNIGNSFTGLGPSDYSQCASNEMFTVSGKYFLIIPSFSTANSASTGFYPGFTVVQVDWGGTVKTYPMLVVAEDFSGGGAILYNDDEIPPQITKLTETSFIYSIQDISTGNFKSKVVAL